MTNQNPYEIALDKNAANYLALSPLSFIRRTAEVYPQRTAVVHGELRRSWRQTYERCVRLASALHKRGIGVGDTVARLKINVLGDDHGVIAVALLPYVKLPTAQSGLGNGRVEGGLILPISFSAPGGFTVIVMPEGDYLKDTAVSGYHAAFDFLINVSHPLDKRWTVYTEAFTTQSFRAQEKPIYTLDEALTCALTPNLQLDFGGNFSLNGVAPRAQFYMGLSQRF